MGNAPFSVAAMTGLQPVESNYRVAAPMDRFAHSTTDDTHSGVAALIHPDNPLLWFGLVLGATCGLVGISGSVRLGKAKASASLDKG